MSEELMAGLRRAALDLLARREHSRLELQQKLARRFGDCVEIDRLTRALAEQGLQSDRRFAENFVHSRAASGHGPWRIRMELGQRGVDESVRDEVLDPGDSRWLELAREIRRKRFGSAPPTSHRDWAKQARFIEQRGFSHEQAWRAVGEVRFIEETEDESV